MAKKVDQSVLDAALNNAVTGTEYWICSGEPADGSTAAIDAVKLHVAAFTSSFSALENGPEGGSRQYRSLAQDNRTLDNVTGSQDITHIATRVGTTLKAVTTTAPTTVTNGNVVDVGEWIHKLLQPS